MKYLTYTLVALFAIAVLFAACKKEDDIEYSSDCYIKSMVLGNLTRTVHTTTAAGADSTYSVAVTGSAFPLTINHIEGTITNAVPLPVGTNITAVTATVTSQGLVVYASVADTTMWAQFTSTDTLDVTTPIAFRVIASDGESYRDYTFSLSVRQDDADKYTWTRVATIEALARRQVVKLLNTDNGPAILSEADDGIYVTKAQLGTATTSQSTTEWTDSPCEGLPANADVSSAVAFDGLLWLTSEEGRLFRSADAVVWSEVTQADHTALSLIAASSSALYATTTAEEGTIIVSSTDGNTWQQTPTEKVFGGRVLASVAYAQPNGNHRVLIATATDGSATLDTWSLIEGFSQEWTMFSDDELNDNLLPYAEPLSIVNYNNNLIAFSPNGILTSQDNGINWKDDSNITLPSDDIIPQSAIAQGEYIYLLGDNQLWQSRLNSYGE